MAQPPPPSSARAEAERCLAIAERLLGAGDFTGSKAFAERALTSDPLVPGADHVLAVAAVLLADRSNCYCILDLPSSPSPSPLAVSLHYRRLALSLRPARNRLPLAAAALDLASAAFAVLSDPIKKALFDEAEQLGRARPPPTFWAGCRACCRLHQYGREHVNRTLRCPACGLPFRAAEIPVPPPVVPGTDMYYCYWGFFPLGFPGFGHPVEKKEGPVKEMATPEEKKETGGTTVEEKETVTPQAVDEPAARKRKVKHTARKTVGRGLAKKVLGTIVDFDEEEEEDGGGEG